jgi:hypothetical protein
MQLQHAKAVAQGLDVALAVCVDVLVCIGLHKCACSLFTSSSAAQLWFA